MAKFVVRFDEDGQNMDWWFDDEDEAIKYAKENIECGPVMYEIDEETGVEIPYRYFFNDEDDDEFIAELRMEQQEQM